MAPGTRVAAVQASSVSFDLAASVEKVAKLVSEAKSNGAQLVVLPEAFLSAYPRHWGFAIGARTDEQRQWFAKYVSFGKSSVKVPDEAVGKEWKLASGSSHEPNVDFWAFTRLCEIAKANDVYLSIGIVERSLVGSTLWCTNLIFSRKGVLLAKHRKLQPTAAERVVWSQGEGKSAGGDNMPVVQTELGRMGGLICWENFMPLGRYVLYKKGVELYLAPTADARPTWLPTMQHIAQEGRCFVISANQYHSSDDFPADYPPSVARGLTGRDDQEASSHKQSNGQSESKTETWSRGGSCIVGPLGEVLAGPLWDKEGIIYADVDDESLLGARLDFDPAGHYAREDVLLGLIDQLR